jgi:hypothetical protein
MSQYFAYEILPLDPMFDRAVTARSSIRRADGPAVVRDTDVALRASRTPLTLHDPYSCDRSIACCDDSQSARRGLQEIA